MARINTVQIVADTIQTVIDTIQNIGCTLQQPIVNEVQVHLETKSSTLEIIITVFTAFASIVASIYAVYSARTSKRISELANDRENKYQNGARLDLNVIPYSDEEITDYFLEKVVIENNGLCSARNVIVKTVSTDDCFFDPPHPIINCVDDRKNSVYTTLNISPNETVELILGHQIDFEEKNIVLEIEWDDDYKKHNTKKVSI